MRVDAIIDWISVTVKSGKTFPSYLYSSGKEREKGMLGYTVVIDMPDGRIVMQNPSRPDMGTHVQYSGGAMEEIRKEHAISGVGLASFHATQGHKITRIDCAVDVFGGFTANECIARYEDGECKTPLRNARKVQEINGAGATLYLGRRGGDRMVRIYDKAAEQGVNGTWTRVEGEFRSNGAKKAVSNLINQDKQEQAIQGIVKGTVDYPDWGAWQEAMHQEPIDMSVERKKTDKTEEWLKTKVAPALAKLAKDRPEWLEQFRRHVDDMIIELQSTT